MIKYALLIFCTFCHFFGHGQADFDKCPIGQKMEFVKDASLQPRSIPTAGSMIVFKFQKDYDCPGTYHDEFYTRFLWAIPKDSTSYTLTFKHADSLSAPVNYVIIYAPETGRRYHFISASGYISGRLNRDRWEIEGDVEIKILERRSGLEIVKDVNLKGQYSKYKNKKRKRYRLFHFLHN